MSASLAVYILDANLLLRLASKSHPHHMVAHQAVRTLRANGAQLRTIPQAVFEFWVVATRDAKVNGLGLEPAEADVLLSTLLRSHPKTLFKQISAEAI